MFGFAPRAFALVGTLSLFAACDNANQAAPGAGATALKMCQYDNFSVDITNGPNKGLHLAGKLFFVQREPDVRIGGHMQTDANEIIPMTATLNEKNDLSLTFRTKTGYVMGLGKMSGVLCSADNVEGAAIGPAIDMSNDLTMSDTGHWLLAQPRNLTTAPTTINFPGDITNQGGDFTFNVTTEQCTRGGGVVELRCGFLCLYTYEACRGGDHNDEVIINGTQNAN